MTLVIAHRTCPRDAPENSIEGIRMAARAGADAVEVDVRRAAGGIPVLLHDPLLARTALLPWPVAWTPASVVQRLRTRGGGRPPTFAAALAALEDGLKMAVDVKDPGAGPATVRTVRETRSEGKVLLWSQHEAALRHMAAELPEVEGALLRDAFGARDIERFLADAVAFGAKAISAHQDTVTPAFLDDARGRGLRVYCWIQQLDRHEQLLALGLDGVVTDWPGEARAML